MSQESSPFLFDILDDETSKSLAPIQLAKYREGKTAWNKWRAANPRVPLLITHDDILNNMDSDLTDLDLSGADLSGVDWFGTNLSGANLYGVTIHRGRLVGGSLIDANLAKSQLFDININSTDMSNADLTGAYLTQAHVEMATLDNAKLVNAQLDSAVFLDVTFTNADFHGASIGFTQFLRCRTLHEARNLEHSNHLLLPSMLDRYTLIHSVYHLPDEFLWGVGYSDIEIKALRELYNTEANLHTCFVSYAHADRAFVDRLCTDLRANRVQYFRDVEDMAGGNFFRKQINEQIKERQKVIIVCSKTSLKRLEVVEEIIEAIESERVTGENKLFPITIDDYVFKADPREIMETLPPRQRREDWLTYLRAYHIPDFSDWCTQTVYHVAFQKMLHNLRSADTKSSALNKVICRCGAKIQRRYVTLHGPIDYMGRLHCIVRYRCIQCGNEENTFTSPSDYDIINFAQPNDFI